MPNLSCVHPSLTFGENSPSVYVYRRSSTDGARSPDNAIITYEMCPIYDLEKNQDLRRPDVKPSWRGVGVSGRDGTCIRFDFKIWRA